MVTITSTVGTLLARAVLCLDDETIYDIKVDACPTCGGRTTVTLESWFKRPRPARLVTLDTDLWLSYDEDGTAHARIPWARANGKPAPGVAHGLIGVVRAGTQIECRA